MPKKLLFTFLFVSTICSAQDSRKIFYGIISDSISTVPNAHILNLQNNIVTYTNDNGEFRTLAKINDTLKISSIGYKTKLYVLTPHNFGLSKNNITLKKETIELNEIVIKSHNLTGNLAIDSKLVKKDTIGELVADIVNGIMNINFSTPVIDKIDEISRMKAPIVKTNPTQYFEGISLVSSSIGGKSKQQRQYEKISKLEQEVKTHKKVINIIGKRVFISEFKIPEDKIEHFVDYCLHYKLKQFIDSENTLELIKYLQEQSVAYLAIIHKEK